MLCLRYCLSYIYSKCFVVKSFYYILTTQNNFFQRHLERTNQIVPTPFKMFMWQIGRFKNCNIEKSTPNLHNDVK